MRNLAGMKLTSIGFQLVSLAWACTPGSQSESPPDETPNIILISDLSSDTGEVSNLSDLFPGLTDSLKANLAGWEREMSVYANLTK